MEKYICKHFPLPIIKLDLLVTETNTKAIALYKKIGFKKIGLDPMRVCDGKKYL
jgi:ribosomal protein S18 acetylase RimI-like enzyme